MANKTFFRGNVISIAYNGGVAFIMATKQSSSKTTTKVAAEKAPKAAAAAPAAKPRTPRVTSAKHSKAAVAEPIMKTPAIKAPVVKKTVAATVENPHDAIAKIAFGYWEARGYQGGDPAEDWFRAEAEYRSQSL
jgi:hypothetical protein